MVSKVKIYVGILIALSSTAINAGYRDDIATIEAQLELVNKQSELNAALLKSAGSAANLPKVLSVMGDSKDAVATLYYPSGRTRVVKAGDSIGPSAKIASISFAGVSVRTNSKNPIFLAFHNPLVTGDQSQSESAAVPDAPMVKPPSIPVPVVKPQAPAINVPVPQPAG